MKIRKKKRSLRKDKSDFTPSPFARKEYESVSPDAPPLVLRELPGKDSCITIIPTHELVRMIESSPELRKAINIVENAQGCETGIKRVIRKSLTQDTRADIHVAVTKKAVDMSTRKQEYVI